MSISYTSSGAFTRSTANPANAPAAVGTISFWFKPNWVGGDGVDHTLLWWQGGAFDLIVLKQSTNNLLIGWNGATPLSIASIGIKKQIWQNLAFAWDGTGQWCYIDGVLVGSGAASSTGANATQETIGNSGDAHTQLNADSLIANNARWNVRLGGQEILDLANGRHPLTMQFGSALLEFKPLVGVGTLEYDAVNLANQLTSTATVFSGDNPTIRPYPALPQWWRGIKKSSAFQAAWAVPSNYFQNGQAA